MGNEGEVKDLIVATITKPDGQAADLSFDFTTPSGVVIQDSTAHIGLDIKDPSVEQYMEIVTETVDRGKGLLGLPPKYVPHVKLEVKYLYLLG